jgi:hypothetical protein
MSRAIPAERSCCARQLAPALRIKSKAPRQGRFAFLADDDRARTQGFDEFVRNEFEQPQAGPVAPRAEG